MLWKQSLIRLTFLANAIDSNCKEATICTVETSWAYRLSIFVLVGVFVVRVGGRARGQSRSPLQLRVSRLALMAHQTVGRCKCSRRRRSHGGRGAHATV